MKKTVRQTGRNDVRIRQRCTAVRAVIWSVSLFRAANGRCLESECARLPSTERKRNEIGRKRKRERVTETEAERERESVRSIIIRSNGGGDGASRRADGQIHNVSRTQRRRSCRRGREGRRACRAQVHPAAAAPRRSHKGSRRRAPSCAVVGGRVSRKGGFS